MARPLSNDLRKRIVNAVEGGMSCNAAAKKYDTAVSVAVKLLQRWKTTGSYEAKPSGGYRGHKLSAHADVVKKLLEEKPDITLLEMQARLQAFKIKVSKSAIDRFLIHLGHSYKKNGTRRRAGTRGR